MHRSELSLRVTPRSSRNEVSVSPEGAVHVRVTAAPTDGEANKAVIELLAKTLGIPKSNIEILSGGASRQKRIAISGLTPQQILVFLMQKGRGRTPRPNG
jgi:uncharacterized protein (TIGR00251 family)